MRIIAIGDIAAAGEEYARILESGGDPLSPLKGVIGGQDIAIASLETPMTNHPPIFKNKICLSSSRGLANALRETGISVVSLANNHIMDCGEDGLRDTFEELRDHNIKWVGAGENIDEATAPLVLNRDDKSVALLAANDIWVANNPFYATSHSPGVAPFDINRIVVHVREYKAKGYFIVISLHWGLELYSYPSVKQMRLAHLLINRGVDLIIGNHVHVVQPVEQYKNGLIIYGQGNVLFPNPFTYTFVTEKDMVLQNVDYLTPEKRVSIVVKCDIRQPNTTTEMVGTHLEENQHIILRDSAGIVRRWPWIARKCWVLLWPLYSFYMEMRLRVWPHLVKVKDRRRLRKGITVANLKEFGVLISRCMGIIRGTRNNFYD